MTRTRVAAALLLGALLTTACTAAPPPVAPTQATASATRATPSQAASSEAPASTPAPAVPAELKFTATKLGGGAFDGASLAGKPVVFWFWAPWCTKCRSEAPAVKAAVAKYTGVAFVGVAGLDTEPAMKEFVKGTETGALVHLSDQKGVVWTKLGVAQQSTFVFMKADGSTEKASGPLGADELNRHVESLLAG